MFVNLKSSNHSQAFPRYGLFAFFLCGLSWIVSWSHLRPFGPYTFFTLWLGFILFVDACVFFRHGTSLWQRMRWRFVSLFVFSAIFWWIFEEFNVSVQNWHYVMDQAYSPLAYFLISSLCFSTVLPAVFEVTEFLATFHFFRLKLAADNPGPRLPIPVFIGLELLGVACLILPWMFPHYCFALIWISLVFLLDPWNNFVGRKSVFAHIISRDWRFVLVPLSGLICGFFWEMWNYFALPKWYYTVPFIGFWKIFEMPLLGYSGYLPFALELFALYQFGLWITRQPKDFLVV